MAEISQAINRARGVKGSERYPAAIIRHTVWPYYRFNLSSRVVEMLAQRVIEVSGVTIRFWTKKSGPQFAKRLKNLRPVRSPCWHHNETDCTVGGRRRV